MEKPDLRRDKNALRLFGHHYISRFLHLYMSLSSASGQSLLVIHRSSVSCRSRFAVTTKKPSVQFLNLLTCWDSPPWTWAPCLPLVKLKIFLFASSLPGRSLSSWLWVSFSASTPTTLSGRFCTHIFGNKRISSIRCP